MAPKKTHLRKMADDYFDMATRYFQDAKHFKKNNDYSIHIILKKNVDKALYVVYIYHVVNNYHKEVAR